MITSDGSNPTGRPMHGPGSIFDRLLALEVSTFCDADEALPVLDPEIRAMVPGVRAAGPALTVLAPDDALPVLSALAGSQPGDVLVISTGGGHLAVLGELFAAEAARRGLAGVVIDGRCRDLPGLHRVGLPIFARGTSPAAGTAVARTPIGEPVSCGGIEVRSGDIVFGDDDGVVIAAPDRVAGALDIAEHIGRTERAIRMAIGDGRALHNLTNYSEHVSRLDAGEISTLAFRLDRGSFT